MWYFLEVWRTVYVVHYKYTYYVRRTLYFVYCNSRVVQCISCICMYVEHCISYTIYCTLYIYVRSQSMVSLTTDLLYFLLLLPFTRYHTQQPRPQQAAPKWVPIMSTREIFVMPMKLVREDKEGQADIDFIIIIIITIVVNDKKPRGIGVIYTRLNGADIITGDYERWQGGRG